MTESKSTKPRWRPRFSLRTLLILVLLIGSGALLWRNWGPYAPAAMIEESSAIVSAGFFPDDKTIFTCTMSRTDVTPQKAGRRVYTISIYDAETARAGTKFTFQNPYREEGEFRVKCTPKGKYVYLAEWELKPVSPLYPIDGAIAPRALAERTSYYTISPNENFAFLQVGESTQLVRLPSYETIWTWPMGGFRDAHFLPMSVGSRARPKLEFISLDGNAIHREIELGEGVSYTRNDDTELIVVYSIESKKPDRRYDFATGALLPEELPLKIGRPLYSRDRLRYVVYDLIKRDPMEAHLWDARTSKEIAVIQSENGVRFIGAGEFLAERYPHSVSQDLTEIAIWDAATGRKVLDLPAGSSLTAGGEFADVQYFPEDNKLYDAGLARVVFDFNKARPPAAPNGKIKIERSKSSKAFLAWVQEEKKEEFERGSPEARRVRIWRQTRPFDSYGIAWLPEFWAVAVLGLGLLWSVWRDRRT